ncbi:hypothetical protein MM239_13730 [Belliella sp. DSM 111904]|uniref:Uncharacterized protein n=1 Tax=Belliella filtrata TaxID=2923435 RepID=A0ABS9V217_9BACT|nr:hypothetical protein [Belliella filtrata]MCH7410462.1 hypothetical protein [Belliella filtrata]
MKKTWIEKFHVSKEPTVKRLEKAFTDMPEQSLMLIATPTLIADYLRQVPIGKVVDIKTLRKDLALEYGADHTCPVTTGIFLRIVAEAAYEALQAGDTVESIAPFWRAIAPDSPAAKKLSFGQEFLLQMRQREEI